MNSVDTTSLLLSVSAARRKFGLSMHALRVWERRYGYLEPQRHENDERMIAIGQIAKV